MADGVDVSENINAFNVSLTTLIAKKCQDYSSNVFVTTDTLQKYPYVGIDALELVKLSADSWRFRNSKSIHGSGYG